MTEQSQQAAAGTPEGQGPVEITQATADRLASERESLFEKFEIPDGFPPEVLEEAEARTEDVTTEIEAEVDERQDLRDMMTWTTDPIDAQDFDDALSVAEREDEYVLWVHIADVTHYVTPDTTMWDEALRRANTVYLPGYTVHMLPPMLAETVCSLVPEEDRLAHTVEMHLDKETLGYEDIEIYKSVIRSDERLTYTECENRLDDEDAPLHEEIQLSYDLADRMHEQRKEDGSLVLNPRRDRAHTIIEESMLKANKAVTHTLMWDRGLEAVYRVHPQPPPAAPRPVERRAPGDPGTRRRFHPRRELGGPPEGGQRDPRGRPPAPALEDPAGGDEGDAPCEVHERPLRGPPRSELRDLRTLHVAHPADVGPREPLDRRHERRARRPRGTVHAGQRPPEGRRAVRARVQNRAQRGRPRPRGGEQPRRRSRRGVAAPAF